MKLFNTIVNIIVATVGLDLCAATHYLSAGSFNTDDGFDNYMKSNVAPYDIVNLGSGTFKTRGCAWCYFGQTKGFTLKAGVKLRGTGAGSTVIKLIDAGINAAGGFNYALGTVPCGNPPADADNIEVSSLTVDANATGVMANIGRSDVTIGGIQIFGSGTLISQVAVINTASERAYNMPQQYDEIFGIIVGSWSKNSTVTVRQCSISGYYNPNGVGDITGINISGKAPYYPSGLVEWNSVTLNNKVSEYAYGVAFPGNITFDHNSASGANRSFNHDTGAGGGQVTLRNNSFFVTGYADGVMINQPGGGLMQGNYIEISYPGSVGVRLVGSGPDDWTMSNNSIQNYSGGGTTWGFYIDGSSPPQALDFISNRIRDTLSNYVNRRPSYYFYDNKKMNSSGVITGVANGFPQ